MSTDFEALRRRFPVLERKTYLNSGSYCALADSVRDAFNAYMDERLAIGANWDVWVMKNEAVRTAMARVLRVTPDEIAVTASASAGINALASALDFTGPRKKVLISDFEFPTNAQIWHAQERLGAEVVHVPPAADGYIPLESFARQIDDRTQLVAVTQVCFRNGARLDIAGITRLAHERGARVMVDCYQAIGSMTVDARALDVDFAVGGMLKYLLGTAGIGFLYVRSELIRELVPSNTGWFAQQDIAAMDIRANRPSSSARRFEAGTPPVVNCFAAEAGLKIILETGTDAIGERVRALTRRCMEGLAGIGWPAVTPADDGRRGPMVAVPSSDAAGLFTRLMEQDIVTSFRDNNIRATVHFYNSEEDIDRFVAAMGANRARFGPRS
ncbi:MAG: aminotransferase class V-fold PLP-dependent enzyme [Gammaproteobacteria bacterium]|nr:aminotransferase class V-fold PLP-dependent enzyme [Gammaproteobacteria bacterium]MDE2263941.1 aminotransferase class V-fold PLP-dependent enzyme [Gammaproteobacteria bacterium]